MSRMKQALFCLILAIFLLLMAVKPEEMESLLPITNEGKETLRIWYGDETFGDYINSAAVAFGENRNIRVLPIYVEDKEYLKAIYQSTMEEGQFPDLFLVNHELLEEAYLSGIAADVSDEKYHVDASVFPESALRAVSYEGKKVAYPFAYDTCVLVYNDTYLEMWAEQQAVKSPEEESEDADGEFEEMEVMPEEDDSIVEYDEETIAIRKAQFLENAVPSTMEDILHFANTFDPPEGVEGIFSFDLTDFVYNSYFVGGAINLGGEAGDDRNQIDIYNEKTVNALSVYSSLNQFFYIEEENVSYDSVWQDFLDGKLVFTIVSKDAVRVLEEAYASGSFPYEYGFVTLPDPGKGIKGRSIVETKAVAMNPFSEHQKSAAEFARFLTDGYANELFDRSGMLPAAYGAIPEESALQVFRKEYEKSVPLPKIMECSNYWLQLENMFSKAWKGEDVETLVQELDEQVKAQLND